MIRHVSLFNSLALLSCFIPLNFIRLVICCSLKNKTSKLDRSTIFHNIINKITSITKENKSFNNQGKLILLSITLLLPSIANVIFDYYKVERSKTNGQKRKTHQKNWYVAFQGKTILWLIGILSLMLTTHSKVKTCHINRVKKNMSNPTTCQQIKIFVP